MKKKSSKKSRRLSKIQKIIVAIIIIAFVIVFTVSIGLMFFSTENHVKSKIDHLARNYYENYYYEKIINSKKFDGDVTGILENYRESGFSPAPLRQILLYDTDENKSTAEYIKKYCDYNKTYIRFYPDSPYGKTDYHIDYSYSCEF